ncbi:MAG: ABC transporter permease [Rhodospirillales bacterium]
MQDFGGAFLTAFNLLIGFDADLMEVIVLSLRVSLTALLAAGVIGLSIGALLAVTCFPGRGLALIVVNSMMGLPPVVVGLVIYMLLSNAGPLGFMGLLYSPSAMIIAQSVLILPIIAALSRQVIEDLYDEYADQFRSFCVPTGRMMAELLWDARYSLLTVLLAGLGRAMAEVGAVIIVGGNINHLTRVMTTTIALETSKGDLALALGLGIVLLTIALAINAAVMGLNATAKRYAYA